MISMTRSRLQTFLSNLGGRGNDISAAYGMQAAKENGLDSAGPIPYSHSCGVEQSGSSLGS